MQSTASTSTMYKSTDFLDCLYAAAIQIWINNSFLVRIACIYTCDRPGTKSICYQLSYPGLDKIAGSLLVPIFLTGTYHKGERGGITFTFPYTLYL